MKILVSGAVFLAAMSTLGASALAETARRIDLPGLLEAARRSPSVEVARARARAAGAKVDEVGRAWIPQLELTAVGGPSPRIDCMPSVEDCASTSPTEPGIRFEGVFARIDARLFMPIYTFGKLSAGRRAAEAGARAQEALVTAAENDVTLDASRAYYGVKLARELILMLQEGRGNVETALKRVERDLERGQGDVTESDRHRLRGFMAEIDARLSEARRVERIALAGVRLFGGAEDLDVDEAPLEEVKGELGTLEEARARAVAGRPERRAALEGARAAGELAAVETRRWFPDLLLGAQATLARAGGADDPDNAFANDPFNVTSASAGLIVRWVLEPGTRPAKVRGARAEAARARATADFATAGVAAEAAKAWAEAADAKERLEASRLGEKETRAWLVSTLQAMSAGLVEPKELGDALLAWFNMRARVLQAIFDWDVAVVSLKRATGAQP